MSRHLPCGRRPCGPYGTSEGVTAAPVPVRANRQASARDRRYAASRAVRPMVRDETSWAPAWYAAEDWLRLVADRPDRIRPCANPVRILHFHDVSGNGTRRWCSMAGCGNRAKAQRHYARRQGS